MCPVYSYLYAMRRHCRIVVQSVQSYPIDQIEYQPHSHAKLLKVKLPVPVHVGQSPRPAPAGRRGGASS